MRVKKSNLEWYVLHHDWNSNKIVNLNVMRGIAEELHKEVKAKRVHDKATLREWLKRELMYHYWSKAEHEICVSGLSKHDCEEKIDAWRQLEMNFDHIVEYVNLRCDLKY